MREALTTKRIIRMWIPLAMSWALMATEGPLLSAAMARLAEPEINLAAYGGIVWPLALIIESPIIMLLAASTALSTDWDAYRNLRKFMNITSGVLTGVHVLVAFSPLYYFFAERVMGVPAEIIEPGRLGLMAMVPWTWAIAYRRFQQGAMIRFGNSDAIVAGTAIRLITDVLLVFAGMQIGTIPGIVVGAGSQAMGVIAEAVYSGLRVRKTVLEKMKQTEVRSAWHWGEFTKFYVPLSLTSFLNLIWQPIGSAALSRMPMAIESLAVWPVLTGLVFILRSPAMAFNEVVVALLGEHGAVRNLRRVAFGGGGTTTLVHFLLVSTPLAILWFETVTGLSQELAAIGRIGLWIGLPLSALNMVISWFQGALVHGKQTRGIPEAVAIYLVTVSILLFGGMAWGEVTGLYIGMAALGLAQGAQALWLWYKSRRIILPLAAETVNG